MRTGRRHSGATLLISVIVLVTTMSLAIILLETALGDKRESEVNRCCLNATALADGTTDIAQRSLLDALANYRPAPMVGTGVIAGIRTPFTIAAIGQPITLTDKSGIITVRQQYNISSSVTYLGCNKIIEKIVDIDRTPIFQFLAFYNSDLEILPGPKMTLSGRIFSNGNIYIGADNLLTLSTEFLRSANHMYRTRDDGTPNSNGTVSVEVEGSSPASYQNWAMNFDSNSASWTLDALNLWKGTVQSSEMGITEIHAPSVQTLNTYMPTGTGTGGDYNLVGNHYVQVASGTGAYADGYFHGNADVSIIDGVAYDSTGAPITNWGTTKNPVTSKDPSMYDAREGQKVQLTEVDLAKLTTYLVQQGIQQPLVYVARTDTSSKNPNGVRLINGGVLYTPLTVVSPDPVYTKGNYNVGDAHNTVKPASIITDAFNILSGAWDDSKKKNKDLPVATETSINVAFITGNTPTTTGNYSGGFENLPRFHEDWTNVTLHLHGSFVANWNSQYATGPWVYGGNHYTAPNRDWNYDTRFNDLSNLPPYYPMVFSYSRVVWKMDVPGMSFGLDK